MRRILLCLIFSMISLSYADGIKSLQGFLQNQNIKADFTQQVQSGKKIKTSMGNMEISRPNKFRWEYKEDGQLIISDGKTIYIYDEPLMQVTRKKLNGSIGRSPALLLAGSSNINQYYVVKNKDAKDNLQWVELTPKNSNDNNGFKVVTMGFTPANELTKMRFVDSFGNISTISFTNLKTSIQFPDDTFKFVTPKGVDVIDETK